MRNMERAICAGELHAATLLTLMIINRGESCHYTDLPEFSTNFTRFARSKLTRAPRIFFLFSFAVYIYRKKRAYIYMYIYIYIYIFFFLNHAK